ncbi:terpenoid synthase [Agrocybe pediades]|nr:terpenoid synthase [Agrocybe pediades]
MIARFTWFLLYVDDLGQRLPKSLEGFQQAIVTKGASPEGTYLQAFRDHLADWYKLWEPLPANSINIAGMEFINGWLLEKTPSIHAMKLIEPGITWPNFLRTKTGSGSSYAFMIFPKELNIDISHYIQVMDDMILFVNYGNDIFSLYKEELNGDTDNFIHNRAFYTKKSIPETLKEVCDETVEACNRVTRGVAGTPAEAAWKRFLNGYLAFHLKIQRYRLEEIGY